MLKTLKKYFNILIIPVCLIIGLIRQEQIQTYQRSIGKPTMTGIFTLYSYIFVGVCLTVISVILRFICHSKLNNALKIIFKIIALIIGLSLACFSLFILH